MVKVPVNEDEFQKWVEDLLDVRRIHVQSHRFSHYPDIPDMSVGYDGRNYWLELKYAKFKMPPGGPYSRFHFKETTRGQLAWLASRETSGGGYCGILGFYTAGPHSDYICYVPPFYYLHRLWNKPGISAGAAILSDWSIPFDQILSGPGLLNFIAEAHRAWRKNGEPLSR